MKFGIGLFAGALALSLVACSDQPSAPATADNELNQLVQRTFDLKDQVAAAGRMTPEHRVALIRLQQDVNAWQARTGRNDITVATPRPTGEGRIAAAPVDGGSSGCQPCPPVKVIGDKVCFLMDEGPCTPNEFITKSCSYACFYLSGIQPVKPKTPTGTTR